MRVAYLLHQSGVGSERLLTRLLSTIDRDRIDPLVILPRDGLIRSEIEALGIPVRERPLSWWIPATHWTASEFAEQLKGLERRTTAVATLLEAERIDLVDTFFIVTIEGALAAASTGRPHVWHSRGYFGNGFPPPYFDDVPYLFSVVDQLADALVCMSRGIEAQAAPHCPTTRRVVIYDGYDVNVFLHRPKPDPAPTRERYGIGPAARVIANIGGIQRRKGLLDLVEAAPAVVRDFPDVVFAIAGVGTDIEFRERLDSRLAALGLQRHFQFIGFEPDIFNLLTIAEALVHPSHSEGFGLAILEAMAVGLPVVVTRCGGPEEMIDDGVSGILTPVGDPAALAAGLRTVLGDPERARLLGRNAVRATRKFSLDNTARETMDLYSDITRDFASKSGLQQRRRESAERAAAELLRRATG